MAKRQKADWWYAYPDDRNRLIEEAREIIAAFIRPRKTQGEPLTTTAARRWLKETKP